ncbi:hypothetical protein E0H73_13375 [Kribbella pittospori]|uniref:Pyruvate phosphate dikinase AMP/ATP-binding domain-containing protein n=1 Tax=Kribbella pittospori TaxID=722689 RepID=A0A4R0KRM3_9ACTN|nr:hypothetical protein E0H73_13375 [Kribbella pittospori]
MKTVPPGGPVSLSLPLGARCPEGGCDVHRRGDRGGVRGVVREGRLGPVLHLNTGADVLAACRRCFADLFSAAAVGNRELCGPDDLEATMAVTVQLMVRSDRGGSVGEDFGLWSQSLCARIVKSAGRAEGVCDRRRRGVRNEQDGQPGYAFVGADAGAPARVRPQPPAPPARSNPVAGRADRGPGRCPDDPGRGDGE